MPRYFIFVAAILHISELFVAIEKSILFYSKVIILDKDQFQVIALFVYKIVIFEH